MAQEMGVGAGELLRLSAEEGRNSRYGFAYVIALAAAQSLGGINKAIAYYNAALAANYIGKLKETEQYYKKAIEINPNYGEARSNYASLLKEHSRKSEAEDQYKKITDPKYIFAHIDYADLLIEKGQFSEAENQARIVLQVAPENPYAYMILGNILTEEDFFEEAIKEYQAALKNSTSMMDSEISEIHNKLGWLYGELKQYKKAQKEFRKACKRDSMNVKARRNLRKLRKLKIETEISTIQIFLGIVLLLLLFLLYIIFWIKRFSEMVFFAQIDILIALLIYIFLYPNIEKIKIGATGIEFEKSPGRTKSQSSGFES
ncbi:MAG: tetratricopeptide repeat protein [Candidatus Methanoperedens sp.]|nr:tetratricopeptide repeat protein [Candidatus Methanoperedens sp.]